MAKHGLGRYSTASLEAIKRAEAFQAFAVMELNEQFAVEDDEDIHLENLTWKDFVRKMEKAEADGTEEELEARIGRALGETIEAILAQQQEGVV